MTQLACCACNYLYAACMLSDSCAIIWMHKDKETGWCFVLFLWTHGLLCGLDQFKVRTSKTKWLCCDQGKRRTLVSLGEYVQLRASPQMDSYQSHDSPSVWVCLEWIGMQKGVHFQFSHSPPPSHLWTHTHTPHWAQYTLHWRGQSWELAAPGKDSQITSLRNGFIFTLPWASIESLSPPVINYL